MSSLIYQKISLYSSVKRMPSVGEHRVTRGMSNLLGAWNAASAPSKVSKSGLKGQPFSWSRLYKCLLQIFRGRDSELPWFSHIPRSHRNSENGPNLQRVLTDMDSTSYRPDSALWFVCHFELVSPIC